MALDGWNPDKKIKIAPDTGLVPSTQTDIAVPIVLRADQRPDSVNDDFTGTDGDAPNPLLWETPEGPVGTSATINSNKLRLDLPVTAASETLAFDSIFYVSGDFDIQIDYDEISNNTPSSGSLYNIFFQISNSDTSKFIYFATTLDAGGSKMVYNATSDAYTTDTPHYPSGKMRFVRSGSTITGYIWSGSQWEWDGNTSGKVFATTTTDDLKVSMSAISGINSGCVTDMDNFTVNSGTIAWPDTSLPGSGTTGFDASAIFEELNGKAEVTTTSPIAWWTMENIDGSTLVDEKGSYDLAINNLSQLDGGAFPGDRKYFQGAEADVTPGFLDAGAAGIPFKSVSMFIKIFDPTQYACPLFSQDGNKVFVIEKDGVGDLLYFYDGATSNKSNLGLGDKTLWHHVVITEGSDSDHHYFWLNGVQASTELQSNFNGILRYFGRYNVIADQGTPNLDNIQVFDYILTQAEIDALGAAVNGLPKRIALEIGDTGQQCYIEVPPDQWDAAKKKAVIFAKLPELKSVSFFSLHYDAAHADNDTRTPSEASDDFTGTDGDAPNPSLWTLVEPAGLENAISIQSNRLSFNKVGSFSSYISTFVRSVFRVSGDFDLSFKLTTYLNDTVNAGVNVFLNTDFDNDDRVQFYENTVGGNQRRVVQVIGGSPTTLVSEVGSIVGSVISVRRVGPTITVYKDGILWASPTTTITDDVVINMWGAIESGTTLNCSWDDFAVVSADSITGVVGETGSVPAKQVWTNGYAAVVIPQDPSGTVLDSVTGNTITINGSMGALADNPFGGKSFVFGGTDDWLIIPHHSGLDATTDLTLDVFYDQSTIDLAGVINKGPFNGAEGDYILTQDVSNWYFRLNDSTTEGNGQVSGGSPAAGWLNVVSTYNSIIQSIYYNGVLNNTAAYTTPIGTNTWDLYVGAGFSSSYCLTGKIAFASVSLAERSADWASASNKAIRDILFVFSLPSAAIIQYLDQLYDLTPEIFSQFLDQEYDLTDIFKQYLDQKYGETIAVYLAAYYGDAPAIRTFLEQRYKDAPLLSAILDMSYEDMAILRAYLEQPYDIPAALIASLEQKYGINEAELRAVLDQNYDISPLNRIVTLLNQVYSLQGDRSVDYITTSLTIGGKIIPMRAASGECSLDNFCITVDVTIADYADYLRINIDDPAVFVNGSDTYNLIVDSKQRGRSSVANTSYQLSLTSPRIALQSPRSKAFTEEYSAGNAETIVEEIIGEAVDWETVGFPILDNKLYANSETKIDIIRKIIRTVGAKLQSNPDGTLRVTPEYPISSNKWDTPDYFMTDTVDFVSQSETFRHNTGFNRFIVRNESTPEDRIWVEQEEITIYKKKILAFQTPWDSDAQFELIHSGGSPVPLPVYHGVVEITQPAEQVEFVAGFSNTIRPIYGNLQVTWLRESLGSITFSEDGKLEAELKTGPTDGYSLAEVTYTTKYHLWHAADQADENVQYILREVDQ